MIHNRTTRGVINSAVCHATGAYAINSCNVDILLVELDRKVEAVSKPESDDYR